MNYSPTSDYAKILAVLRFAGTGYKTTHTGMYVHLDIDGLRYSFEKPSYDLVKIAGGKDK